MHFTALLRRAASGVCLMHRDLRPALFAGTLLLAPAAIGISRFGPYFSAAMPSAVPLKGEKVMVQLQEPWQKADFFLVGFPRQPEPAHVNAIVRAIEAQGIFKYAKSYNVSVRIFGERLNLARFSSRHDLPFPDDLALSG